MKTKKQRWLALTGVVCLLILVGGWFLVVSPKRSQVKDVKANAAAAQQKNAEFTTQLAVLKAQSKDLARQNAALAAASKRIPTTADLPGLLRRLQGAATQSDVTITALTPAAPTPLTAVPGVSSVTVSISVSGTYFAVEEYINDLEGLDRALMVTGITAAPGSDSSTASTSGSTSTAGGTATADAGGSPHLSTTITAQVFTGNPAAPAATPTPQHSASTS